MCASAIGQDVTCYINSHDPVQSPSSAQEYTCLYILRLVLRIYSVEFIPFSAKIIFYSVGHHTLWIYTSVDERLGYIHILGTVPLVAMIIDLQMCPNPYLYIECNHSRVLASKVTIHFIRSKTILHDVASFSVLSCSAQISKWSEFWFTFISFYFLW